MSQLWIDTIILLIGLGLLIKGADWLVMASSSIARKLKVPDYFIALTLVSVGTSLPELILAISSSLKNESELVLGNIIGSNIFNLLFVLGISAIINPILVKSKTLFWEIPFGILSLIILTVPYFSHITSIELNNVWSKTLNLNVTIGKVGYSTSMILFILLFIFIAYLIYNKKQIVIDNQLNEPGKDTSRVKKSIQLPSILKLIIPLLLGLVSLFIGGEISVASAISIASSLNISKSIIALSIIAIGTSLPELITSVVASIRKKDDIALGNIVGSSIFNICLILPFAIQLSTVQIKLENILALFYLVIINLFLFISTILNRKMMISRYAGVVLLLLYGVFWFFFFI